MFALGVRYRLSRAGGADTVRAEFNQWVASRPTIDPHDGRKFLFMSYGPDGSLVLIPPSQLPPGVRYMRAHVGWRFGMTMDGAAVLDNVAFPNTAYVMIGPPGWRPREGASWLDHLCGSHRRLADGIWIKVGLYDK